MDRKIIVLLLVLFCAPTLSNAQNVCEVSSTNTVIVFGNGVDNSRLDADGSLSVLRKRLKESVDQEKFEKLEFALAYNRTSGTLTDFLEAAKDKFLTEGGGRSIIDFSTAFWKAFSHVEILPDWFQEAARDSARQLSNLSLVNEADLSNHLALYRSSVLEGKTVLLVAHSQGNFFANRAHEILYQGSNPIATQSFGIVSVANPASFVGGNGAYTTLTWDLVILAIAAVASPPPLPSNVDNGPAAGHDLLNHGFVTSYLVGGTQSETKILADIETSIALLEDPVSTAEDGIITATLSWGPEPDVDLHAFEPNSTHVYYTHSVGISGYLDVDDITSYGPEHYFVGCDTLEEGMYRIGVNYFHGSNPEVAIIQVQAGLIIRSFEIPLSSAVGLSGDNSPILVADIFVGIDENGVYEFAIMPTGGL